MSNTDNAKRTGPAVEAHYQFVKWLAPTVEKFPKVYKFTIGDRIYNTALDVLEDQACVPASPSPPVCCRSCCASSSG
jgi:hypothetical protein